MKNIYSLLLDNNHCAICYEEQLKDSYICNNNKCCNEYCITCFNNWIRYNNKNLLEFKMIYILMKLLKI